jgi:hypothetical protein
MIYRHVEDIGRRNAARPTGQPSLKDRRHSGPNEVDGALSCTSILEVLDLLTPTNTKSIINSEKDYPSHLPPNAARDTQPLLEIEVIFSCRPGVRSRLSNFQPLSGNFLDFRDLTPISLCLSMRPLASSSEMITARAGGPKSSSQRKRISQVPSSRLRLTMPSGQ